MKEYFGQNVRLYGQTPGKTALLIPAIKRALASKKPKSKLLDVGCGNAYFIDIAREFGFEYSGLDISKDMLDWAREEHPDGKFTLCSATEMTKFYSQKFDIILISMLFLHFNKKDDILKTLVESKKLLNPGGIVIIGNPHPCFDSYMRKKLFDQKDVESVFAGYFKSGTEYFVHKDFGDHVFTFDTYHWTLADLMECVTKSGLKLTQIDECQPDHPIPDVDQEYQINRSDFPTYIALTLC